MSKDLNSEDLTPQPLLITTLHWVLALKCCLECCLELLEIPHGVWPMKYEVQVALFLLVGSTGYFLFSFFFQSVTPSILVQIIKAIICLMLIVFSDT